MTTYTKYHFLMSHKGTPNLVADIFSVVLFDIPAQKKVILYYSPQLL